MYCKTCGFMNKANSNYCRKCGESLMDENDRCKTGLQKQTWIILIASIVISLVIGVGSTMFLTSGEVKTVVELVLTGEEQAISEVDILMENLSDNQKKDVINKINEGLLASCEMYISEEKFSEDFYEKIINIGWFLIDNGEIQEETIIGFPTLEYCYQELLDNETDEIYIWTTGERYIQFFEDISVDVNKEVIDKTQNAVNVRASYASAVEYYQAKDYPQALEICAGITPAEDDDNYISKVTKLKDDILDLYGEQIPAEVTQLLENENNEEAWVLLKGIWSYFNEDAEIRTLFEQCVEKYLLSLLDDAEYDKAATVANESYELMDSETIKAYKDKMEQEHWKLAYWSVLKNDPMETEFCLYEVKGQSIPILILILDESYQFISFNENTEQVECSTHYIQKYDKENDVFYKYEERDERGEYSEELWGRPYVHVEEWLAYSFDGSDMVYEYSLKKEVSEANDQIVDANYTFNGMDLKVEVAYDAQLLSIKGAEGLATNSITEEEIEKALFN